MKKKVNLHQCYQMDSMILLHLHRMDSIRIDLMLAMFLTKLHDLKKLDSRFVDNNLNASFLILYCGL